MKEQATRDFWVKRMQDAAKEGWPITSAIVHDPKGWYDIQEHARACLEPHLKDVASVLDVGCGYGSLSEVIGGRVSYYGIDLIEEFLNVGRLLYPTRRFHSIDLAVKGVLDDWPSGVYDLVVGRSVEGTIGDGIGLRNWVNIVRELLRIGSGKVVFLSYNVTVPARVVTDIVEYEKWLGPVL